MFCYFINIDLHLALSQWTAIATDVIQRDTVLLVALNDKFL